jgi:dipeptidyl-peptidase-4
MRRGFPWTILLWILFAVVLSPAGPLPQGKPVLSMEDYARAEKFLSGFTDPLVFGGDVQPTWINDKCFWYRNTAPEGHEFVLVNVGTKQRGRAFDHEKLASALSAAAGKSYEPFHLPLENLEFSADMNSLTFSAASVRFTYDLRDGRCRKEGAEGTSGPPMALSPDGKRGAFIREYNLWMRDLATGKETPLTTDGVKDFGYATDNAGWIASDRPVLLWSPDSKKIATFQQDERGVGEMFLVATQVGHPELKSWKYPLPEDKVIFRIQRVIIHVDGPRLVRLRMPPDEHRSTVTDHIALRSGELADAEWSPDSSRLAFVSVSRDHKHVVLRLSDPENGDVRDILHENVDTFFESGFRMADWHVLPASNEAIWFSERDDWGHLYLYDLATGELKRRITSGQWNVLQVLRVDAKERTVYFTGAGREPGDPYYRYLYSASLDKPGVRLLTPENADHNITLSGSGSYFVDSYSTPVEPPLSVVRDRTGRKIITIEKADTSRLIREVNWVPPVPFSVKARDGKTDLYGLMFKPSHFDPGKKYPIINSIYPGPQMGSVDGRSFKASRGDKQALAELGFIVVSLDAMGTPMRSKSFHAAYYGNMGDNGLPDQIAGMKQLAERYPWIDIDRAGIYGYSGGGFASTDAILRYPDFFKVAVSGCGNHDNRCYEDDWGEKWQGLLEARPDGTTNYDNQANQLLAKNLKGKLLLMHGTMDTNVPYYNTLLVVNALIAGNKDFDLLLVPNRGHGFFLEPYVMRREWDYFVINLLGAVPPKEYAFHEVPSR